MRFRSVLSEYGHRVIHGQPDFIADAVNAVGGPRHFLIPDFLLDRMDQLEASGHRPSVINMRSHNNM